MTAKVITCLRREALLLLTLLGVCLGFGIGFAIREADPSDDTLMWIGLPGQLYLRTLRMMIVPLIICSVIAGTSSLDPKMNGKITLVSFVYIFFTNMFGTILGIVSWLIFQPGKDSGLSDSEESRTQINTQDIFADLIRNIFPENIFKATFSQDQTKYREVSASPKNSSAGNVTVDLEKYLGETDGANLLGLIMACTLIGIAASAVKERGKIFVDFFMAASEIVTKVIRWFMWTTPVGVLSLIAAASAGIVDVEKVFRELGLFIAAVVVALALQQILVLPLVLFVTTRRNPAKHMWHVSRAWIIAFATASSAISIPEMITACEHKLKIDSRIVRFVISFCVTLSANGSAVFIACSCLFIANLTGHTPNVGDVIVIGLLVTVSSLAIPSVPSASIVTIIMILSSVDIPAESIALLLALEFLLDRLRTTSSVTSNTMCAAVTHHFCRQGLISAQVLSGITLSIDISDKHKESSFGNDIVVKM